MHFDVSLLNDVKWEEKKHLAEGSVVMLSFDHFNTLIYGIVRQRQPNDLKHGIVDLQIPRGEDVAVLFSNPEFYMIDSLESGDGILDVLSTLQLLTDVTLHIPRALHHNGCTREAGCILSKWSRMLI